MTYYTIGTSNRTADEFFWELTRRRVTTIVDVRSRPCSRLKHFNRDVLRKRAEALGIQYEWAGEHLGGLTDIATDHPDFQCALSKLVELGRLSPVAFFCSEGDPAQCHRTWKLAASLVEQFGVEPVSILRDGGEEPAPSSLLRVRPADGLYELCFGNAPEIRHSRK